MLVALVVVGVVGFNYFESRAVSEPDNRNHAAILRVEHSPAVASSRIEWQLNGVIENDVLSIESGYEPTINNESLVWERVFSIRKGDTIKLHVEPSLDREYLSCEIFVDGTAVMRTDENPVTCDLAVVRWLPSNI